MSEHEYVKRVGEAIVRASQIALDLNKGVFKQGEAGCTILVFGEKVYDAYDVLDRCAVELETLGRHAECLPEECPELASIAKRWGIT